MGCRMTAELDDDGQVLSVSGNTCPRGEKYAVQECTCPTRVITAVIPVPGSDTPLSVKTSVPVPKEMISRIMDELGRINPPFPVSAGDVIVRNLLGTGSDLVATRNIPE